ncbi:MAG: hypothetical protein LR011_02750 [Verrucomicrobia bacterium]|nr:hypothetical protein [Verrucomicrobiota bacterium]
MKTSLIHSSPPRQAFSLLEVVIAMGIFFMAIFVILEISSSALRSVFLLHHPSPDPRELLGDLIMTNQLEEISESGDFGDQFKGYVWERTVSRATTSENDNGLYQVDVRIRLAESEWSTELNMLLFKPSMATGLGNPAASSPAPMSPSRSRTR